MKIYTIEIARKFCPLCHQRSSFFYVAAPSKDKADSMYPSDPHFGQGICGNCMIDFMRKNRYVVVRYSSDEDATIIRKSRKEMIW
jgi:hypothetical protein